jgi:hypothetical protein
VETQNKNPTRTELNQYIQQLQEKEKKRFPPVTNPLPIIDTIELFTKHQSSLPRDPTPFNNALDWMNTNLESTLSTLQSSLDSIKNLQGFSDYDFPTMEYFGDVCQAIKACQDSQNESVVADARSFVPIMQSFQRLQNKLDKNNGLIARSKDIQEKAQNGTLIPTGTQKAVPPEYTLDPDIAREYKGEPSLKQLTALKKLITGIKGSVG